MQLYHVVGGIGRVTEAMQGEIRADVRTGTRVLSVQKNGAEKTYQVEVQIGSAADLEDFDAVILALPNHWLTQIKFHGPRLQKAIHEFLAHYDLPAHYLRVSFLFREKWWAKRSIPGDFWMMDFCNGCAVYDESTRWDANGQGHVLSFLLGGQDALNLVSDNQTDAEIARYVLDRLPADWRADAEASLAESRVERYIGSINANPGSWSPEELIGEHAPEPKSHPGLFLCCDALFDSTLNACLMSAGTAVDLLIRHVGAKAQVGTEAVQAVTPEGGEL
jgi:monoamine oxidase